MSSKIVRVSDDGQDKYMITIIPTDTCYGLAGNLTETDYLEIYRLKGRDFCKPLALLIEDFDDMKIYIEISQEQIEFLRNYQYPWSYLGKRNPDDILPGWMSDEQYQMISLRVAESCIDANIRNKLEFPLFLTSANISWMKESSTLTEAMIHFPWIAGLDGGLCDRPPSDIFSIGDGGRLIYLRQNF